MNKATQDAILACANNNPYVQQKHSEAIYRHFAKKGANTAQMKQVLESGNADYIAGEFLEFSYDDKGLLIEVSDMQAYKSFLEENKDRNEPSLMTWLMDVETGPHDILAYGSMNDDFGNLYSADCIYVRESVVLPEDSTFYEYIPGESRVYVHEDYVFTLISGRLSTLGYIYLRELSQIVGE